MILLTLLALFAELSLLAVGGVASTLPAMARALAARHWMSNADFAALFGVAQSLPGPNTLIATLVGLRVAGVPGAIAATIGMITPSCTLAVLASRVWDRFRQARWRRVMQAAITPVSAGLLLAAAALLIRAADHDWRLALVTAAVCAAALGTRRNPLLFLAIAAALGAAGLA
jgi:chromate transporter